MEENPDVIDAPATAVVPLTSVNVPVFALKGALACASDEETRYYLNGVFLHRYNGELRTTATDGHRMFVASLGPAGDMPDWLDAGVIIPAEDLKLRLAFIEKLKLSTAVISYAKGGTRLVMSDVHGDVQFRMTPVDGTFPEYQRVIDSSSSAFSREAVDFTPVGYNAGYLKEVGTLAKILDSEHVQIYSSTASEPSVVTFTPKKSMGVDGNISPGARVVLYLMPIKGAEPLAPQQSVILDGAIKGTLAALRAHKTRWEQKLDAATSAGEKEIISEKMAEYDSRIAATLEKVQLALPAPEHPSKEMSVSELARGYNAANEKAKAKAVPVHTDGLALPKTPEEIERDEREEKERAEELARAKLVQEQAARSSARAGLSNKKRKAASADFLRTVRETLHRDHAGQIEVDRLNAREVEYLFTEGYSLNEAIAEIIDKPAEFAPPPRLSFEQYTAEIDAILEFEVGVKLERLGDDVPVEEWYAIHLTPQIAAERAQEWLPEHLRPPKKNGKAHAEAVPLQAEEIEDPSEPGDLSALNGEPEQEEQPETTDPQAILAAERAALTNSQRKKEIRAYRTDVQRTLTEQAHLNAAFSTIDALYADGFTVEEAVAGFIQAENYNNADTTGEPEAALEEAAE